jgi:predicted RNA binding protein YcfA (HicA-like mRNA interferase family)
MKIVSGKWMCKALAANGWGHSRTEGSHHIDVRAGSPLSIAVSVHGSQDLKPGTQRKIMRQAGLTDADL